MGFIASIDREGRQKNFPLLSASAVVLHIPVMLQDYSTDQIAAIAELKKEANASSDKIVISTPWHPQFLLFRYDRRQGGLKRPQRSCG
jgi:hypothetical protein